MRPTGHWIRYDLRWAIYVRDHYTCVWCGVAIADPRPGDLTLDHLFPQGRLRDNHPRRLVTACVVHNSGRRGQTVAESMRRHPGSVERILRARRTPVDRRLGAAAWAEARQRPPTQLPDLEPGVYDGAVVDSRGFIW